MLVPCLKNIVEKNSFVPGRSNQTCIKAGFLEPLSVAEPLRRAIVQHKGLLIVYKTVSFQEEYFLLDSS